MPQNNLFLIAKNTAGKMAPLQLDGNGALVVSAPEVEVPAAPTARLNISAATIIKAAPGVVLRFTVVTAGTAAGTINDCLTTGAAAAANAIATIPEAVGTYTPEWPCSTGIVVAPGAGQVVAVLFA
ncbi:MAG TPA: hypothetical protein VGC09_00475 [Rhodopila sp.]